VGLVIAVVLRVIVTEIDVIVDAGQHVSVYVDAAFSISLLLQAETREEIVHLQDLQMCYHEAFSKV